MSTFKKCKVVMLPTNGKVWIQGIPIENYIIAKRIQNPLYYNTPKNEINKLYN